MYAELLRDNVVIEVKIKSLTITKLCSEDFCAYTEDVNPKPEGATTNLRSAGQVNRPENIEIYLKNRSKTVNELYYIRNYINIIYLVLMTKFQEEVIKYIDEGLAVSEISRCLNKPMSSVGSVLKRFNLKAKKSLIENTVFDEYFDNIDSDPKAYYLGFLIADGTINKDSKRSKGRIGFLVSFEDSYILEKLKIEINSTNKIYKRINKSGSINRKPQASFRWTSVHMKDTLVNKYGIIPNKTLNISFKFNFDLVPKRLWGSLIRGFIDGDGSFEYRDGNFNPSIIGTSRTWIEQLGNIVSENTELVYKIYEIQGKTCKYYTLRWSAERTNKFEKITNLYNFLYRDATVFLERKKNKIVSYLKYRANYNN